MCVLALVITFGPWGVFSVSEKSQVDRLQEFLTKHRILSNGPIQKAPEPVPQDDTRQISSIIAYFNEIHGYDRIQLWFRVSLNQDSLGARLQYRKPALVAEMMGIEYLDVWYSADGNDIWLRSNQAGVIDVQGYERMIRGQYIGVDQEKKVITDQELLCRVNSTLDTITFIVCPEGNVRDSMYIDLHPLVNRLLTDYPNININNIPPEKMMLFTENQNLKIKIYFRYIKLHKDESMVKPIEYGADILYKIDKK